MSEDNKALARRSWEIVNQRSPDLIEEVYPPDFVWHEPDQDIRGYEQAKQFVSTFLQAFPDINIGVEDVIAEGDKVVSRYTIRGTHQGELMSIAPTGKEVTITGIDVLRIAEGKVVERWAEGNDLEMMQQLGVVPPPGQAKQASPPSRPG